MDESRQRTYPLSALFVLMAACAVVASLVTPVVRGVVTGQVGIAEAAFSSIGGSLLVMLLCGVLGLYHYRPVRGLLWGLLTGGIIGLIVGPVIVAPTESFGSLLTTSLLGAVVLIGMGAFLHWTSRDREAEEHLYDGES